MLAASARPEQRSSSPLAQKADTLRYASRSDIRVRGVAICLLSPCAAGAVRPAPTPRRSVIQRLSWRNSLDLLQVGPSIPPCSAIGWRWQRGCLLVGTSNTPCCRRSSSASRSKTPMMLLRTGDPISPRNLRFTLTAPHAASDRLRMAFAQAKSKLPAKFVLINTPFESAKLVPSVSRIGIFRP